MAESNWREINRANWDERVDLHLEAESYDLAALGGNRCSLYQTRRRVSMAGPAVVSSEFFVARGAFERLVPGGWENANINFFDCLRLGVAVLDWQVRRTVN
jgi:hypothetical protein